MEGAYLAHTIRETVGNPARVTNVERFGHPRHLWSPSKIMYMVTVSRRGILGASAIVLAGSLAGCAGFVSSAGSELPDRIPLYARNERDEHVSLEYWCSTTASVPDDLSIDGVAHLERGEESQLTEIPVAVSDNNTERGSTHQPSPEKGESSPSPPPVTRPTGSGIGITADLQQRDDQRNVLLHVNPESKAFSEAGYRITVLSEPVSGVGTPDQPVSYESVPSKESIAADFIRIAPRSDE